LRTARRRDEHGLTHGRHQQSAAPSAFYDRPARQDAIRMLPHRWLVIADAHTNLAALARFAHGCVLRALHNRSRTLWRDTRTLHELPWSDVQSKGLRGHSCGSRGARDRDPSRARGSRDPVVSPARHEVPEQQPVRRPDLRSHRRLRAMRAGVTVTRGAGDHRSCWALRSVSKN